MPAVIPLVIAAAGSVAGKMAEGRAKGRAEETQVLNQRDQTALDAYRAQNDATLRARDQQLAERKFANDAPNAAMSQLLRGSLAGNFAPRQTTVEGITPAVRSGGPAAALMTDDVKQGGNQMVSQALQRLMTGEKFDPLTLATTPTQSEMPKAGKMDTFLNILGGVGSVAGAVSPYLKTKTPAIKFESAGGG